jgi:hypothetical protein
MPQQKSVWLTVLIWAVGALLFFYIIAMCASIFNSAKSGIARGYSDPSCARLSMEVDEKSVSYAGRRLEFSVKNTGSTQIKSIGIFSDSVREPEKTINISVFYRGYEKEVVVENFAANGSFFVFPEGCSMNAQEINIS